MLDRLGQVSASQLKARGWSETMIAKLLGAPASTARNPHCPGAAPARLYSLDKVLAVRETHEFHKAAARAAAASRRAIKGHQHKVAALTAKAWRIAFELPPIGDEDLRAMAQDRLDVTLGNQTPLPLGIAELIAGYATQILLEVAEPCMQELDDSFAVAGVRAARAILRKRVLSAIASSHPWLKQECQRRFRLECGAAVMEHEPQVA